MIDLSEGAQPSEDASPNPRAVLAFWWCRYLDSHIFHRQFLHLVQQSFAKPFRERGPSGENYVAEQ